MPFLVNRLVNIIMQNSYPAVDNDHIYYALESLFGPEIWDNPLLAEMAKKLNDAELTAQELDFIVDSKQLPSKITTLFD